MSKPDCEALMRRALAVAHNGWGTTHPNPMVGCVIVEDGTIVAEGFHERDGGPHAEKAALAALGRPPRPGAVLCVTLEPCSTSGRTGACTEAILASGIRRVIAGATDPSPEHRGRGFEVLRAGGVEVTAGVLEADCLDLNLLFNHWVSAGTPLMAAKLATTIDGRIATRSGESKWITGEPARADVHRWRKLFPAIAAGAGTVAADNPRLTIRRPGFAEECSRRFIFDGRLRTAAESVLPTVYSDDFRERTTVVTTQHAGMGYVRRLREAGIDVWIFESPRAGVPFADFRRRCAAEGVTGVLFEGGARLTSRALIERELDYLLVYQAPVILADERARSAMSGLRTEKLAQAVRIEGVRRETIGDDSLVRGRTRYPERLQVDETLFSLG